MVKKRYIAAAAVCVAVLAFLVGYHCIPRQIRLELPAMICAENGEELVASSLLVEGTWLPRFCSGSPRQFRGTMRVADIPFTSGEDVWSTDLEFEKHRELPYLYGGIFYNTVGVVEGHGWAFVNKDFSQVVLRLSEWGVSKDSVATVVAPANNIDEAERILEQFQLT